MDDALYSLGFSAFSGIGTRRFEQLMNAFGSAEEAWNAQGSDMCTILGKTIGRRFDEFRKDFNLESYAREIEKKGIHYFIPQDKAYPALLRQLSHPPFILFAKGNVNVLSDTKTIGIVGTRRVTNYGQQVTELLTRDLVAQGFVVVSGMALGVDGTVHRETLKNNGKTIAVLGSGVDVPLPREHEALYQQILNNNGLIISTFQPGEGAGVGTFPARNAIIAGLSQGIVVTEGAEKSGALITANYAKKFGRPVFSVPGQITSPLSKGTNNLIRQGAVMVSSAQEILDTLGIMMTPQIKSANKKVPHAGSPDEDAIVKLLKNGPLHFDEIVRTMEKDSREIGSLLSLMELKGIIKSNTEGKYFL